MLTAGIDQPFIRIRPHHARFPASGILTLGKDFINRVAGTTTYYCGSDTWGKDDVIALSLNVNPYCLTRGYSPSQAVQKWATADDYIAEYQTATFRNGAVPAGELIITAPTVEDYNEIVDQLQKAHRGANNTNNLIDFLFDTNYV